MSYLGIYTNNLQDFDLSEHLKAETIDELEAKETTKQYLQIYEITNDILEEAQFIYTKILR